MDGDRVTIHNLRNCDYRTETDYSNCWSDRTVDPSQIRGAELFRELGNTLREPSHCQFSIWRQRACRFLY